MDEPKVVYIRFFAGVNPKSANTLMQVVQQKLKEGTGRFVLLISSMGGNVFSGISAYNFLKGIPAEIWTHNFGSVDSIAVVLFCAGSKRFSVPHARFLLHGIGFDVTQGTRFDEKLLDERIKSLASERENISRVIADNTGKQIEDIERDILAGTVLNSDQARDYGLVHEVKSELVQKRVEIITITDAS